MITASIVTYKHSLQEIEKLVTQAVCSEIGKLYIIDNSPTNDLADCESLSFKIEYFFLGENIGFGAGHNIAINDALNCGSTFHIVLNPDIEMGHDIPRQLEKFMLKNLDVGMLMPKIVYPNGEIQYLAKMLPTPLDWIGRRFIPFRKWVENRNHVYELRDSGYDKIMDIPYLSGCFMFIRSNVLKEIGLFDERIFMYGEDTDLTRRIFEKYRTLFYPDVTVTHVHNKESYRNYKLLWIHMKAAIYYFNKWGWFFDKARTQINNKLKSDYLTKKK